MKLRICFAVSLLTLGQARGSNFCVAAPTLLGNETCSGNQDVISLRTSSTTSWKLDCPGVAEAPQGSRQCRRHQLYAVHLGLDSIPASFYWKPKAMATGLAVSDKDRSRQIWAMDTTIWKDVTLGRDSGRPCRVCSERLNASFSCAQKLTSEEYITFESINENINKSISYFAFECSGIPDENVTESPSPSDVPPMPPQTVPLWNVLAIVGAVDLVAIAVVLVVVKVRKSRSSREAAIPADDLHDPGRDDDREDDHDYCYVDLPVSNAQLEQERRATRTDCGGETTSLRSHDSENSAYGEIHSNVSQREGQ
ncbi:uncharacterized protein LOC134778807 isoform X2 [Penaeus indicus]|uniref:uncharacterized protein LOC134778807 isoform X2 n=1 Tax=Penaeus indicus TaxID=29960 RepID=UPI00300CB460